LLSIIRPERGDEPEGFFELFSIIRPERGDEPEGSSTCFQSSDLIEEMNPKGSSTCFQSSDLREENASSFKEEAGGEPGPSPERIRPSTRPALPAECSKDKIDSFMLQIQLL